MAPAQIHVLPKALPISSDIAGISHGYEEQVRGVAHSIYQFECGCFLSLDPVGVHGVDQSDIVVLGEFTNQSQGRIEVAVNHDDFRAVDHGLGQLAHGYFPLGNQDEGRYIAVGAECCRGCAGVASGGAHDGPSPFFQRLGYGHHHPTVLERPGGVTSFELEIQLRAAQFPPQAVGLNQRGVALSHGDHGRGAGQR